MNHTLVQECSHCGTWRPLDEEKCPQGCVTLRNGLVALCDCGTPMLPDGRDWKQKFQLLRCPNCGARSRIRR